MFIFPAGQTSRQEFTSKILFGMQAVQVVRLVEHSEQGEVQSLHTPLSSTVTLAGQLARQVLWYNFFPTIQLRHVV
jgi:hypothetical protein